MNTNLCEPDKYRRPHPIHRGIRAVFFCTCTVVVFSSCKTTEEIKREQMVDNLSVQVVQGQKLSADTLEKIDHMENKVSELTGKIEEMQFNSEETFAKRLEDVEEKVKFLEENSKANQAMLKKALKEIDGHKKFIQELTKTLKTLVKKPKSVNKKRAQGPYQMAMGLYRQKKYSKARPILLKLEKDRKIKGQKKARVLHNLGMIAFISKKYDDALTYFSKLYTNYPKSNYSSSGLLYLGKTFQRQKNNNDAINTFNELVNSFPKSKHAKTAQLLLKKLE